MKKKIFLTLNVLLMIALLCCVYVYTSITGKLVMKGITAGCFVGLGTVNLIYALLTKPRKLAFPAALLLGLVLAMSGDLTLGKNFILGAGLFAAGHLLYTVAMYIHQRFSKMDAFLSGVMFLLAMALLTFLPSLDISDPAIRIVCYVYAVIISLMAGKAISCFLRQRTLTNALLALGSVMFYFSDVMLILAWFAGAGRWADLCCCWTYFPGQGVLAISAFCHVRENAA